MVSSESGGVPNGFAIGRSIYGGPARRWLANEIDEGELMSSVAEGYERMSALWQKRTEQQTPEGARR